MVCSNYKYIYGPVYSWRLGMSLGIDPLSDKSKICNFDCVYCQLGKTVRLEGVRKNFVPANKILEEIKSLPPYLKLDYITFSGRGEPTLAKNLGQMIKGLRKIRKEKIAVITNAALIYRRDVQKDLSLSDFVLAKLDACSDDTLEVVDKAIQGTRFDRIVDGIKNFRSSFSGKLALQIMFIDANKKYAPEIARIAKRIAPDEVELNTPLRPCAVPPLSKNELARLKVYFKGMPVVTVYEKEKSAAPLLEIKPFNESDTIKRHGNYKKTLK